jgi:hypothetical protein
VALDGVSLLPLLRSEKVEWPDRTFYFQWHRGDRPDLYRAFAARSQRWKLVSEAQGRPEDPSGFKLFDMQGDSLELEDIAARRPEVVREMLKGYEAWFRDVSSTRGFKPPRIVLGTPFEDTAVLSRQDWRGPRAGWADDSLGHWEVEVRSAGLYEVTLRFKPLASTATARFALAGAARAQGVEEGTDRSVFRSLRLEAGPGRLEAWLEAGGRKQGVQYVEVKR